MSRMWKRPQWGLLLLLLVAAGVLMLVIGGYTFGWAWTGLTSKTFWDWLQLLIVPIILAGGGYWFSQREARREYWFSQREARREYWFSQREARRERRTAKLNFLLQESYSNVIRAFNETKGVRRSLRARARYFSSKHGQMMIRQTAYSEQMEELINILEQFETFISKRLYNKLCKWQNPMT